MVPPKRKINYQTFIDSFIYAEEEVINRSPEHCIVEWYHIM